MNPEKTYQVIPTSDRTEATWLTEFSFPWLDCEVPETRFRAWRNADDLCFEFQVRDDDLVLDESPEDDDKVLGSDRVELFFSPTPDLSLPYYGFEMDPRGLVFDYEATYHRNFTSRWTLPSLHTNGTVTADGYCLEGSFPLDDLKQLGCFHGSEIIAGVYRAEFSHNPDGSIEQNWISWIDPETEIADFHIPETFGRFVFV